eukprot:gene10169-biopygen1743
MSPVRPAEPPLSGERVQLLPSPHYPLSGMLAGLQQWDNNRCRPTRGTTVTGLKKLTRHCTASEEQNNNHGRRLAGVWQAVSAASTGC